MNTRYLQSLSIMIGLLFMISPFTVSADTVEWCDDFENGICEEWTVILGDWETTDGYMRSLPRTGMKIITRNSSQVEGTWSFDVFQESECYAYETTYMFMAYGADIHTCFGYGILLSGESIYFIKQDGDISTLESLGFVMVPGLANTWTRFNVTRDSSTGRFNVFLNATTKVAVPDISVVDTNYTVSEQFVVRGIGCDCYIDNVTLSDEIGITEPDSEPDPTPTTSTPTSEPTPTGTTEVTPDMFGPMLLSFGVAAVGVVFLVVLVVNFNMKKR